MGPHQTPDLKAHGNPAWYLQFWKHQHGHLEGNRWALWARICLIFILYSTEHIYTSTGWFYLLCQYILQNLLLSTLWFSQKMDEWSYSVCRIPAPNMHDKLHTSISHSSKTINLISSAPFFILHITVFTTSVYLLGSFGVSKFSFHRISWFCPPAARKDSPR